MLLTPVLGVTGFQREAKLVAAAGLTVLAGGGDSLALAARLEAAAPGATGIVSFGLAGALTGELEAGDWIVGDRLGGAIEMATDPRWRDAALAKLPGAQVGAFFADGRMIASVDEKRSLGRRHGALAVDMESHVAGEVARRHGIPFAIIRVVSDAVDQMLPPAILVSMRADGGIDGRAMARSLWAEPRQIPQLLRTARAATTALRALADGSRILGAGLGCPYLGQFPLDMA